MLGSTSSCSADPLKRRRTIPRIAAGVKQTAAPFPAGKKISEIYEPVYDEEPRDGEMPVSSSGKPSANPEPLRRRRVLERIPRVLSALRPQCGISGEYLQPTCGHQHDEHDIAPMGNLDGERLLAPPAESTCERLVGFCRSANCQLNHRLFLLSHGVAFAAGRSIINHVVVVERHPRPA